MINVIKVGLYILRKKMIKEFQHSKFMQKSVVFQKFTNLIWPRCKCCLDEGIVSLLDLQNFSLFFGTFGTMSITQQKMFMDCSPSRWITGEGISPSKSVSLSIKGAIQGRIAPILELILGACGPVVCLEGLLDWCQFNTPWKQQNIRYQIIQIFLRKSHV